VCKSGVAAKNGREVGMTDLRKKNKRRRGEQGGRGESTVLLREVDQEQKKRRKKVDVARVGGTARYRTKKQRWYSAHMKRRDPTQIHQGKA